MLTLWKSVYQHYNDFSHNYFEQLGSEQDIEIRYDVNELIVYSTIYKVIYILGDQTDFLSINRSGSIILNHHDSSIIFAFLRSSGVSWHSKETRNKNPWAPEETEKSESEVSFSYGTTVSFLHGKSVPFQWKELIVQFSSPLDTQKSHRYIFKTIFYIKSFGYIVCKNIIVKDGFQIKQVKYLPIMHEFHECINLKQVVQVAFCKTNPHCLELPHVQNTRLILSRSLPKDGNTCPYHFGV